MIHAVVIFSLVLSAANWGLFVTVVMLDRIALVRLAARRQPGRDAEEQGTAIAPRTSPDRLARATGSLATSFRKAGPQASAAAMSLACLLVAAIAAGIDKF